MARRPSRWFVLAIAAFALVGLAVASLWIVPSEWVAERVARAYSADGIVSLEGRRIVLAAWRNLLLASTAGWGMLGVLAWLLQRAHRAALQASQSQRPIPTDSRPPMRRTWVAVALVAAAITRVALASLHWGDSFSYDELFTLKHFASRSLAAIFGLGTQFVANNHILNSLCVRSLLLSGAGSEGTLRAFSVAASVGLLPAAAWLWRRSSLKWHALAALLAVTATSPLVDFYSTQMRGYVFAMLFAALASCSHLLLIERATFRAALLLAASNVLLALSNIFTLPLLGAQVAHLLWETLRPGSSARNRGARALWIHVAAIGGSACVALLLHACALPWLVHDAVIFASHRQLALPEVLSVMGAALWPTAGWVGGIVVIGMVAAGGLTARTSSPLDTTTRFLFLAVGTAVVVPIVVRQGYARMTAYVHVLALTLAIVLLARLFARLGPRRAGPAMLLMGACVALGGLREDLGRGPYDHFRETIGYGKTIAGTRPIWSSGYAAEPVDFYAPNLWVAASLSELPSTSSVYLSFCDRGCVDSDPILRAVHAHCRMALAIDRRLRQAVYECPPLTDREAAPAKATSPAPP
jgi:hypothetical protein